MNEKRKLKQTKYFLTVFKIAGHETWRTHLAQRADGFAHQVEPLTVVTDKKTYTIDRITGEVQPVTE